MADLAESLFALSPLVRYVALLRDHIAKEDEMLFPMAVELIPPSREEELLERFDQVEAEDAGSGAHARLMALAAQLAREAELIVQ